MRTFGKGHLCLNLVNFGDQDLWRSLSTYFFGVHRGLRNGSTSIPSKFARGFGHLQTLFCFFLPFSNYFVLCFHLKVVLVTDKLFESPGWRGFGY